MLQEITHNNTVRLSERLLLLDMLALCVITVGDDIIKCLKF